MTPHLAITMGDPAGVGPEIIVKACLRLKDRLAKGDLRLLVIGSNPALHSALEMLGAEIVFPEVTESGAWPNLACLQAGPEGEPIKPGVLSADGGRFAYLAVEKAVRLAQAGRIQGIVTAPLNKEALNKAGYKFAGHTDMLATLTESKGSVMMLAHGNMRVSHVTTHVALKDVPGKLTPDRLRYVIERTDEALQALELGRRKIAIAALNPHAGEGGLFGREDDEVSAPTIARAVADGFDVVGPVPGDTVFVKLRAGQYDAVVAMYHDQGHIPSSCSASTSIRKPGPGTRCRASTSRSVCRSCGSLSITAPPSTSPARASPTNSACSKPSNTPRNWRRRAGSPRRAPRKEAGP